MCEINLETMQKLLIVGGDVLKQKERKPDNGINKVKNLISETKNFIGTLDIYQLSSELKIDSCNVDSLPKKNYLIIIKTMRNTEPLKLFEMLQGLKPLGVGIIYIDDLESEEVLIIS